MLRNHYVAVILVSVLTLNRNTSLSVIRKLVNKGILEVASIKMSGSVLARRFQPKVTELEVLQSILNQDQILLCFRWRLVVSKKSS